MQLDTTSTQKLAIGMHKKGRVINRNLVCNN
jgi:hypothetical protein